MSKFKSLHKIVGLLQSNLTDKETYTAVFDLLDDYIKFSSATLFVIDSNTNQLQIVERRGPDIVDLASEVSFSLGGGLSGWSASQKVPIILPSLGDNAEGREFRSMVSIPLWSHDALVGVLNLGHKQPGHFLHEDKTEFHKLGLETSVIVEQLKLRSELAHKNAMLEKVIAELSSAQSALVEKEKLAAVGAVVVKMKHDINNPLSIIISYADLIEMDLDEPESDLQKQILKIRDAAYRISDLTKALDELESVATEEYGQGVNMIKTD